MSVTVYLFGAVLPDTYVIFMVSRKNDTLREGYWPYLAPNIVLSHCCSTSSVLERKLTNLNKIKKGEAF